jgi:DNA-binding transcriptional ArsR family regulator
MDQHSATLSMQRTTATELHFDRLGEIRVAFDPFVSVLSLLTDALGRRRGAPGPWRRQILAAVSPHGLSAVRPIAAPDYSVTPDCVTPRNPSREISVCDQVEWLHDISDDELLGDIHAVFDERPPPHWERALRRPRNWMHAYADAIRDTWRCVEPWWKQAQPMLDREVSRVGTALVRGELDLVLDGLHPASRFAGGVLSIRDPEPARFDLAGRPLVLVPMLSGEQALICNLELPDVVWIGYPLRGVNRMLPGAPGAPPPRDTLLESMIGPVRAQLLLALSRPATMGELARLTRLAPSAITYHCERLAAAGLVHREKWGRRVSVSRTSRGTELIDLLIPPG